MLALTFSTGVADAVGYLGLDRVFTGNMTGNVVILAMALAGADDLPVTGPLVALCAFMLGAALAGRVLRSAPSGWSARATALFAVVGALLAGVGLTLALAHDGASTASGFARGVELASTAGLALAMGTQAATARHIAVKDVTTVVVTSTITGLAADSWLGRAVPQPWVRRTLAIVLIGAGASAGAVLLRTGLAWGVVLAMVVTIGVATLGRGVARRGPA
ncbi:DUF1275 domain-containing protein [Xylanimonas allomyrinae]|uniref:DUF1275 domain-containing protein n=2 Tax=Xylanimonas allomyrinae TaxID=2509459 RepID=A0A4P6EPD6_9MICO|nr:DUF1275 domain-containing protein [Xylanimonas allomyrinae]